MPSLSAKIRDKFNSFYLRARKTILPDFRNVPYYYRDTLKAHVNDKTKWLDLGCGRKILPEWMPSSQQDQELLVRRSKIAVGIDCDISSLRKHNHIKNLVIGDINNLPFKNGSFNLISANNVVEHIENPNIMLCEIFRIIKQDGIFVFLTTNILNYKIFLAKLLPDTITNKLVQILENRQSEDIYPTFHKCNNINKIHKLCRYNSFDIKKMYLLNSPASSQILGPLAVLELLLIKLLSRKRFANFRSNILCVLQKA
jgi:ubiquinone/menaquinone biosynthesis C-methylase UbiE